LLTIDKRRAMEGADPKQLPPRDRPCTFCGVPGEFGVAVRDVRAKAHGYFCWYTAGTWLGRIGRAEEQGAIGRQQLVSFNDDALNVRAENAERGEDAELRHARPGPRRAALAATGRHSGAVNNADE